MLSLLQALIALLRPTDALFTAKSQHLLRPTDAYKQIREASPLSFALLAGRLTVHTPMQAWLLARKFSGSAYTRKKTSSRKRTRPMFSLTTCYDVPPCSHLSFLFDMPVSSRYVSTPQIQLAIRFPVTAGCRHSLLVSVLWLPPKASAESTCIGIHRKHITYSQ